MNNKTFEYYGLLLPAENVEGIFPVIWKSLETNEHYIIVENKYYILNLENSINVQLKCTDIIQNPIDNNFHVYGFINQNNKIIIGQESFIFNEVYGTEIYNELDCYAKLLFAKFYRLNNKIADLFKLTKKTWHDEGFNCYLDINDYLPIEKIESNKEIIKDIQTKNDWINKCMTINSIYLKPVDSISFIAITSKKDKYYLFVGKYNISYHILEKYDNLRAYIKDLNVKGYFEFASQTAIISTNFENELIFSEIITTNSQTEPSDDSTYIDENEFDKIIESIIEI